VVDAGWAASFTSFAFSRGRSCAGTLVLLGRGHGKALRRGDRDTYFCFYVAFLVPIVFFCMLRADVYMNGD
jgi:hypothetical protein